MCRTLTLALLLLLGSAPQSAADPARVWLELDAPAQDRVEAGPIGLVEVRGWAGAGELAGHDVVIAIDTSGSTAYASGADVDGDGKVGRSRERERWRSFNPRFLSSDPGDTVLAGELLATQRLVELLDSGRTRVGLVAFAAVAKPVSDVGSEPGEVARALRGLEGSFGSGGTNIADATRVAAELLAAADRADSGPRRASILLLSDGYPTVPEPQARAESESLAAAREAAARGVRIFSFALGPHEIEEGDVFARMATVSGGRLVRVEEPGNVVHELPQIDLADIAEVTIQNETSGRGARATRVFPDGSFDAYVLLVEGENVLRVTATGRRGGRHSEVRRVLFEKRPFQTAAEAERFERRVERLRARTSETEVLREMERLRDRAPGPEERRTLEIDVDPRDADPAGGARDPSPPRR
jgi:hypothetical protein